MIHGEDGPVLKGVSGVFFDKQLVEKLTQHGPPAQAQEFTGLHAINLADAWVKRKTGSLWAELCARAAETPSSEEEYQYSSGSEARIGRCEGCDHNNVPLDCTRADGGRDLCYGCAAQSY